MSSRISYTYIIIVNICTHRLYSSFKNGYHCFAASVSNEILRREDNILVFSAKGCSFETDASKLVPVFKAEINAVYWTLEIENFHLYFIIENRMQND